MFMLEIPDHLIGQFLQSEPMTEQGGTELAALGLLCRVHRWPEGVITGHFTWRGRVEFHRYKGYDPRGCASTVIAKDPGYCSACKHLDGLHEEQLFLDGIGQIEVIARSGVTP